MESNNKIIAKYLEELPDSNPATNPHLMAQLRRPDYEDRGMNGPMGGKNGTVSQVWLAEHGNPESGPSEFGLMTIVPPAPESDTEVE